MDDYPDDKSDSKRQSRNLSEKKRRDQFNTLLTELGNLLDGGRGGSNGGGGNRCRMDKTTILKSTIAFLRQQQEISDSQNSAGTGGIGVVEFSEDVKPGFLSSDAFVYLMMEALDSFLLVVNATDGQILYASEGIMSLLGYIPVDLAQMSIYDVLTEDDRGFLYKLFASNMEKTDPETSNEQVDVMVHMKRGGVERDPDAEKSSVLVLLSGFFRRWQLPDKNVDADYLEDDQASIKSGNSYTSSHVSTSAPTRSNAEMVFVATARLQTAQLIREMPMKSHRNEFCSRYSLEWKFIYLDHKAPPIIGYLPFELLGTSGYDYYHHDDLKYISECHEALMHTGEGTSCCYRFLTKGQQWIWLQTRYFITYHQWNSKPEFVVATHKVINYQDVMNQLTKDADPQEPEEVVDARPLSYTSAMSPTWSSRSSVCGSSSTAPTKISQDQSSCRLSNYSRSEGVPCENVHDFISSHQSGASNDKQLFPPIEESQPECDNQQGGQPGPSGVCVSKIGASGQQLLLSSKAATASTSVVEAVMQQTMGQHLIMKAQPAAGMPQGQLGIDGSQPLQIMQQVRRPVALTPVQLRLQQQLRFKHAALSKKILEQQEELRRTSEQLLMSEYGLVPVPLNISQMNVAVNPQTVEPSTSVGTSVPNMALNPSPYDGYSFTLSQDKDVLQ